jgi:hypothetical protein
VLGQLLYGRVEVSEGVLDRLDWVDLVKTGAAFSILRDDPATLPIGDPEAAGDLGPTQATGASADHIVVTVCPLLRRHNGMMAPLQDVWRPSERFNAGHKNLLIDIRARSP